MPLIRVFIPFALGYFLSYLYRVVNAVIAPDLISELGLGASDLGLLTSAYFLTFALFQLPLGMLLDHYGPRKTEAILLLFAAMGAFVFALSHSATGLIVGRALIGLGVSSCLMAAFKAYSIWVPRERLPLINGFQMSAGGLGALSGTMPVEAALSFTDWRGVFLFLGVLTVISAAVIFFVVPKRDEGDMKEASGGFKGQIEGVIAVFTSPLFWWIAPLTVTSQAAFLSIQSLWVGPWLHDVGGLERNQVASHLLLVATSMIAGFISWGVITDHLRRFGIKPMPVAITGMSLFIIVQCLIAFRLVEAILPLWMLFGFFATAGILPYAALSQKFPLSLSGRVNTGLNLLVFVSAFAAQWGTGVIIGMWPKTAAGNYDPAGYQAAFGVILGLQVVGLLWLMVFTKGRRAFGSTGQDT
ncbi:MAG: MFS transporter [Rhodospirillales bacterium]|nr:MFS transporter [Rhodospirillales bacterium]